MKKLNNKKYHNNPLITVYITNYNYGKYIEKAINSVLNQTEQNFELIIIDDGSTDNSMEIIRKYEQHEKIKIVSQKNKGLTVTNNIALRLAQGKYIVRLDADDYFDENALSVMANIMEKDPEVSMVFGDWYFIDEQDNILSIFRRHNFEKDVNLMDQPAHGACTMFRVSSLRGINGYDETLSRQDGYELWFRYIFKHKIRNVNLPLFYYRQHGKSLTKNERKLLDVRAEILKKHSLRNDNEKRVIGILPIRGNGLDDKSNPFLKVGNKNLIDWTLEEVLKIGRIEKIYITTPDDKVIEYIEKKYINKKVKIVKRNKNLARLNTSLSETLFSLFENESIAMNAEAFFLFTIETPFKRANLLESAINMMQIFETDTIIGVTNDNSTFFKHNGKGLIPINHNPDILRLERDQLYRLVPGYTLRDIKTFLETGNIFGERVGHVIVEQTAALTVTRDIDLQLADFLAQDIEKAK